MDYRNAHADPATFQKSTPTRMHQHVVSTADRKPLDPEHYGLSSHTTSSGLAYKKRGSGPVLVLLHGGAGSWRHWICNIAALSQHFTVLAFDCPGYGESADIAADCAMEDYVQLVANGIAEAAGRDTRVHISGFSFGAQIGMAASRLLGDRMVAISTVGAAGFPRPGMPDLGLVSTRRLSEQLAREPTQGELRELHGENLSKLMIWDRARITDYAIDIQIANVARIRFDSRRYSRAGRMAEFLANAPCPVRMIYGDHDVSVFPSAEHRLAQIRDARPDTDVVIVPGTGHWSQFETPQPINDALIAFHSAS